MEGIEVWTITATLVIMTVIALLGFLVGDISTFAQTMLERGFVDDSSKGPAGWLAKVGRRAGLRTVLPVLESTGIDGAIAGEIRRTLLDQRVRKSTLVTIRDRPDQAFLALAQRWIVDLSSTPGTNYGGNQYYWDLMAASSIDSIDDGTHTVADVMSNWIFRLRDAGRIGSFDVVVAPKDGNVHLAQLVAAQLQRPLILAKGDNDNARVARNPQTKPHITDFEGLGPYVDHQVRRHPFRQDHVYRALLIDDSCRGGSVLSRTMRQFNALLPDLSDRGRTFEPIHGAVILFRIRPNVRGAADSTAGFTLRALVSVSQDDLVKILGSQQPAKDKDLLKECTKDSCCQDSREILAGRQA